LQNPNEDPNSTQRLILAFALIFVVIIASQWLLQRFSPKQPPAPAKPTETQPQAQTPAPSPTPPSAVSAPAAAQLAAKSNASHATKQAASESETVVENDLYRITFSNRGGAVKSWVLKQQKDEKNRPLELVHPLAAPRYGLPLTLHTYDADLMQKLNTALYVASSQGELSAAAGLQPDRTGRTQAEQIKQAQTGDHQQKTLTFEFADGDTQVTKTFRFDDTYVVHADVQVTHKGALQTALFTWPAGFGDQSNAIAYSHANIAYNNGSDITRLSTTKSFIGRGHVAVNGESVKGPLAWAGPEDQYFAAIFLPDHPQTAQLVTFNNGVPQDPQKDNGKTYPVLGAAVGNTNGETSLRVFVGPKLLRVLSSVHAASTSGGQTGAALYTGPTLDNMIDFGFFGFIAKPLFLWLRWTYEHVIPNWGWSILIVTIIINLALLPLRLKQIKSSMKMMRAQPHIDAINRKYQGVKFGDQQKMTQKNQEIQALYQREGINPVGGCLPLLVQIPILWAFFKVLEITVELRHAPWAWIHDLSAPDPLHIIPILLFLSMLWLQRMTPTPGMDPVQAKMMQFTMPLVFGWMSWNFAAGLSVYYTTGNIIAIVQQQVLNKTPLGKEMREAQLKRARTAQGAIAGKARRK
jgi:YidC/Oxa1 family membrane protein insertase